MKKGGDRYKIRGAGNSAAEDEGSASHGGMIQARREEGRMSGEILVGEGREIRRVSDEAFVKAMERLPERMEARLRFMTREHHAVRDFVVRELPRFVTASSRAGSESRREVREPKERSFAARPADAPLRMTNVEIARGTGIETQRVAVILAELEKHLFFLVRNAEGEVSWAFPVTTERTEHRLTFSSGEKVFGA